MRDTRTRLSRVQRTLVFTLGAVLVCNGVVYLLLHALAPDGVPKLFQAQTNGFTTLPFSKIWNLLWIPLVVLIAEVPFMGWKRSSAIRILKGSLSARHDLLTCLLRYGGILTCVSAIFFFGLETLGLNAARRVVGVQLVPSLGSAVLGFVVWLIVFDLFGYAYHRLTHRVRFMWEWHKYHHAATEFNVITGARVHFLESGFLSILLVIPVVVAGAPLLVIGAVMTTRRILDQLQHSMLPWTYGWIGRWLLYSPVGHRIHHSPHVIHWDKNYGDHLVIWDRMFGSWYAASDVNETVGVSDNYFESTGALRAQYLVLANVMISIRTSTRTGVWLMPHISQHVVDEPRMPTDDML